MTDHWRRKSTDQRRVIGSTDVYGRKMLDKRHDQLHRRIDLYGEKISSLREELKAVQATFAEYKRQVEELVADLGRH